MIKIFRLTVLILFFSSLNYLFADRPIGPEGEIRVGIFPFEPMNYIDENGKAQGLFPELLREITKNEDWTVSFVSGSWAQGLERLENEEIDLMISVAYTEERDKIMDYNYESVVELWEQVYIRPEDKSTNINDLNGKKVAIMSQDINGTNFINTASELNVQCEILEYPTHGDVFKAVQDGFVDGGVAPQHFGLRNSNAYNLIPSSIQFNPFSIYFASKEGKQADLLSHIDSHLIRWKVDNDSFYYDNLAYWMTGKELRRNVIPQWLVNSLALISGTVLLLFLFTISLRIEVKKSTSKLIKKERQYRDLVENANSIIIRIDKNGNIIFANKFGLEFFGFIRENLIGMRTEGIIFSTKNDIFSRIKNSQVTFDDEIKLKTNVIVFIQWNNKVIYDDSGSFEEVLCIGMDITEQKTSEVNLKKTNEQLEEMVYIASHDLQVPLVSMEGYASELLENYKYKLDEEGTFCLTRLQVNSRRMHKLVLSLLDISRLNTILNTKEKFSMNQVLDKIVNDISLKLDEEKAHVNFRDLPPLQADRQRIESVFRNLIINSLNYGGEYIEVSFKDGIFQITDDGIGIPHSQLERIFKPGERLKMNKAEGVGMGLTFSRKVVEKHKGRIWVESEGKGEGCTFYIKFPPNLFIKDNI